MTGVDGYAYVCLMKRHTTINLDEHLIREASQVLGTERVTDTVHAALAEVVAARRREWLVEFDFSELSAERLEELRRGRMAG